MRNEKKANRFIRGGMILYWTLFWLFNSLDKLINDKSFWIGRDRLTQFIGHFSEIGITNSFVPSISFVVISILEFAAFAFLLTSLVYFFKNNKIKARSMFFWGIGLSLIVFSIFSIGDQVFGERAELLEHTIYWIAFIISWFVYTHADD